MGTVALALCPILRTMRTMALGVEDVEEIVTQLERALERLDEVEARQQALAAPAPVFTHGFYDVAQSSIVSQTPPWDGCGTNWLAENVLTVRPPTTRIGPRPRHRLLCFRFQKRRS